MLERFLPRLEDEQVIFNVLWISNNNGHHGIKLLKVELVCTNLILKDFQVQMLLCLTQASSQALDIHIMIKNELSNAAMLVLLIAISYIARVRKKNSSSSSTISPF